MWWEGVEECSDALPCRLDGPFGGFAQEELELGEHLFNRIEVGRLRRQEQEPGPGGADRPADKIDSAVASEIRNWN